MNGEFTAALLGLFSGMFWGTGDFFGGWVSRRVSAFSVVFYGQITGSLALLAVTLVVGDAFPPFPDLLMGAIAGVFGSLGLLMFYRAMTVTKMSVAAPVTAVLTAIIPIVVGFALQGAPAWIQMLGMLVALAAIALISREDNTRIRVTDLRLPMLAGIGFGMYLTLIARAGDTSVFWPILTGRAASIAVVGIVGLRRGVLPRPSLSDYRFIAASGLFDTLGNTLYALSAQFGRLDVAAILSSLYPAATVGLAWLFLKERLHRVQWAGVALALLAVILITL